MTIHQGSFLNSTKFNLGYQPHPDSSSSKLTRQLIILPNPKLTIKPQFPKTYFNQGTNKRQGKHEPWQAQSLQEQDLWLAWLMQPQSEPPTSFFGNAIGHQKSVRSHVISWLILNPSKTGDINIKQNLLTKLNSNCNHFEQSNLPANA